MQVVAPNRKEIRDRLEVLLILRKNLEKNYPGLNDEQYAELMTFRVYLSSRIKDLVVALDNLDRKECGLL